MNRRDFSFDAASVLTVVALGVGNARAAESEATIGRAARALHRRAIVLDANLAPPAWYSFAPPGWDPEQVTSETVKTVHESGLTTMKLTLGGFNAPFEETLAEIAAVQRLIEARPDVFTQIRGVEEIAAAKAARKLGIIFSFESAASLEDKLDRINLFRAFGVRVMQLAYNIAHMTHALDVCGEDHVGIGSDASFDTLDLSQEARARWDKVLEARRASGMAAPEEDRMPYTEGLNRADRTLVIADALLRHGYPARVTEKVLGANFVRAFREIW